MNVLVTRAAEDAARTAAGLARLGHRAIEAPAIAIVPQAYAVPVPGPAALVATSRHAFANPLPERISRDLPAFAVGGRTADAARAAGLRDVRIGAGDAEALLPLIALTLPRPGPLLYLAGRDRKPGLEAALAKAGYKVEVVEAYAAEPAAAWPEAAIDALRARAVDATLHYSRRSANLVLSLAAAHGVAAEVVALKHVCLSDDAAAPLVAAGAASVAIAARPDEDALFEALRRL